MMGHRTRLVGAAEWDAFYARQMIHWQPGETRLVKRGHNKRVRHETKVALKADFTPLPRSPALPF